MVERSLSMGEAPGSIPGFSISFCTKTSWNRAPFLKFASPTWHKRRDSVRKQGHLEEASSLKSNTCVEIHYERNWYLNCVYESFTNTEELCYMVSTRVAEVVSRASLREERLRNIRSLSISRDGFLDWDRGNRRAMI